MSEAPNRSTRRALAGLALAACATCAGIGLVAPARGEVRVTDDADKTLVLAHPAERIVSLAPHVTELLFAAGAGNRIVGTVRYSDYPPAALSIPRIGDSFIIDAERVVALRPEVVVVWLHGNPETQLERLRRLGIPVFASEPRTLVDIGATIRRFGRLAGTERVAEATAAAFETRVRDLRERYASRSPVRVFYQVAQRPLLTINGRHLIDEVLRLCGGANIFESVDALVPTVTPEAVAAADPEAIVTAGGEAGNDPGFEPWQRMTGLTATRRGNFIVLPSDTISRQSDRIVLGAERLCAALDRVRARRP